MALFCYSKLSELSDNSPGQIFRILQIFRTFRHFNFQFLVTLFPDFTIYYFLPAGNFCQPAVKHFYLPPGKLQNIEISIVAVKFPFFVKFLTIRWRGSFSCNFDKKMMKNTSKLQEITVKLTKLCNKSKERHAYVMNCGRHGVFLAHAPASAAPAQLENGS